MSAAGAPPMLTSGVQAAPAGGAKHSSRVSDSESREKQLLAQIKELTRQLDKEKNRKKEQARASRASKEQRRRLVICSQLLPYRLSKLDDGTLKVGGASSKLKAYGSLHQRLDVAWVGCPAMHVPAQQHEAVRRQFLKLNCHPVFITESEMELAEGMWAEVLWPLFHYIPVRRAGCVRLARCTGIAPSAGSHCKPH
jgi:trehalose 6-phosphate synthase/phosphatase